MKQGRCCREKAKRGRGLGKSIKKTMSPLTVLPQGWAPQGLLPARGCLSTAARSFQKRVLPAPPGTFPGIPPLSPRLLHLSPLWFFLPLSLHEKSDMGHVIAFISPRIATFQNFPLWLTPTGSILWHPILLENTLESFQSCSWP